MTGLMRGALEEVEERRRRLARDLADVTFEPSQCEAVAPHLPQPTHPLVRLRLLISLWGVIREQVRRRYFSQPHHQQIESYYQDELGWRPRQIVHLLALLYEWARHFQKEDQASLDQYVKDTFGDEAGRKGRCQELERLLEEQIAVVEGAFAEEMKAQERERRDCAGLVPRSEGRDCEHGAAPGNGAGPGDRPQGENPADHAQGAREPESGRFASRTYGHAMACPYPGGQPSRQ